MENFLRKHKLIDEFTVELPIHKSDFVRRLQNAVDPGDIGAWSGAFEAWEASNNDYKGEVTSQGFKIRRRKKFFQSNGQMQAVATGTFTEGRSGLTVRTEITSQSRKMVPLFGFILFFYFIVIGSFALVGFSSSGPKLPMFVLPIIVLHGAFMFFVFYHLAKRSVEHLKRELEREFVFLASQR